MTAPKRAYSLTLTAGADDLKALAALVYHFADGIEQGTTDSVTGGCDSGGYFKVTHDPEMSKERYVQELQAYLKADETNLQTDPHVQNDLNERIK